MVHCVVHCVVHCAVHCVVHCIVHGMVARWRTARLLDSERLGRAHQPARQAWCDEGAVRVESHPS